MAMITINPSGKIGGKWDQETTHGELLFYLQNFNAGEELKQVSQLLRCGRAHWWVHSVVTLFGLFLPVCMNYLIIEYLFN